MKCRDWACRIALYLGCTLLVTACGSTGFAPGQRLIRKAKAPSQQNAGSSGDATPGTLETGDPSPDVDDDGTGTEPAIDDSGNLRLTIGSNVTGRIDYAIVLDTSGSMKPYFAETVAALQSIIEKLPAADVRAMFLTSRNPSEVAQNKSDDDPQFDALFEVGMDDWRFNTASLTYGSFFDGNVFDLRRDDGRAGLAAQIEKAASAIEASGSAVAENSLQHMLLAYQSVPKRALDVPTLRADAAALVVVAISDENASVTDRDSALVMHQVRKYQSEGSSSCLCSTPQIGDRVCVEEYESESCATNDDGTKTCHPTTVCLREEETPDFVASRIGGCYEGQPGAVFSFESSTCGCDTFAAGQCSLYVTQPYEGLAYENVKWKGGTESESSYYMSTPEEYLQAASKFRAAATPKRALNFNFVGLTGGGCAADTTKGQSDGTHYMKVAALTGGKSFCIKDGIAAAFAGISDEVATSILTYALPAGATVVGVKRGAETLPASAYDVNGDQITFDKTAVNIGDVLTVELQK